MQQLCCVNKVSNTWLKKHQMQRESVEALSLTAGFPLIISTVDHNVLDTFLMQFD